MVKQHLKFQEEPEVPTLARDLTKSENPSRAGATDGSTTTSDARRPNERLKDARGTFSVNPRKRAVDFFEDGEHDEISAHGLSTAQGHAKPLGALQLQQLLDARQTLPIAKHVQAVKQKVQENNVIILLGETGSGKSTQLPQYLLEISTEGCIAVTQPRRVAAISLAKRVSEEMNVALGGKVGYSIRFDDKSSKHTRIKYLTDGMLLIELLRDPLLSKYAIIVLDEAHERTLLTDLLLGFMKKLLKLRLGLKVVVMSATLDAERFSSFFDDAEIVRIEGRTYPIDLYYSKIAQADYLDAVLRCVFQMHMAQPTGDVLVFLTGADEIENLCRLMREYAKQLSSEVPKLLVLPLYASLSQAEQARVFLPTPKNSRKVILSTNIAETSITVPGVRYVIDTGLQKVKSFNAKIGFESLEVSPISQSSADQRTGRAGREAPGKCWRLYQESIFNSLDKSAEAEIRRVELSQAILALKARGVDDVLNFDYIEPPSRESIVRALEHLYSLGALDDKGDITTTGRSMSSIPLSPPLARVLLAAQREDCVSEIIDIVSCLSVDGIFLDKSEKREEIAEARKRFESTEGDHITLLNVLRGYLEVEEGLSKWCDDIFLDKRAMKTVLEIRKQLHQHASRAALSAKDDGHAIAPPQENILRAFLTGFISHTAFLTHDGSYRTTIGHAAVSIHPSSSLYGKKVEAIVYHESVYTTRLWVRGVSRVDAKWIREVAPAWTGRSSA